METSQIVSECTVLPLSQELTAALDYRWEVELESRSRQGLAEALVELLRGVGEA